MNLSKETLTLIRNFSAINGSIMLKAGNTLSTMAEGKNVMASVTLTESFPCDFGIYDLGEFLGAVSVFSSPQLDFHEKFVNISDGGNSKIKFYSAGEGIVKATPTNIKFPSPDVEFTIEAPQLAMILKTASTLKASDVSIMCDGTMLQVNVLDKKNPTSNAYQVDIAPCDTEFKANFKIENLKMLPGDYDVAVSSKKISRFRSKTSDLTYFVAVESDSEF